jgi:hypothetical protein
MGSVAASHARRYSWDAMADATLGLYRELAGREP